MSVLFGSTNTELKKKCKCCLYAIHINNSISSLFLGPKTMQQNDFDLVTNLHMVHVENTAQALSF